MFHDPYYWRPFDEILAEGIDPNFSCQQHPRIKVKHCASRQHAASLVVEKGKSWTVAKKTSTTARLLIS
jgi:hypothetical protein